MEIVDVVTRVQRGEDTQRPGARSDATEVAELQARLDRSVALEESRAAMHEAELLALREKFEAVASAAVSEALQAQREDSETMWKRRCDAAEQARSRIESELKESIMTSSAHQSSVRAEHEAALADAISTHCADTVGEQYGKCG